MDKLTLSTFGLGIVLAWGSLLGCALVLRVPFAKGRKCGSLLASPTFRYRTLVLAWMGAASMLLLPSLRESGAGLSEQGWQGPWSREWSEAAPVRAAVDWVRPWVGPSEWSASPVGHALAVVALLWGALVVVSLVRTVVGHVRLGRVCARATEAPLHVQARAAVVAERLGMRAPVLLVSDETEAPFATGFLSPRIVLPRAELAAFSEEQLDFVLHHELVHVERGDLRVAFLVGLARLVFTGHPLGASFLGEIAVAREASVDARVAQDRPLQYAHFLLELAQRLSMANGMKGTVPMADSTLSRRIALLLSPSRACHAPPPRTQRRAAMLLGAAGLVLAACVWFAPTSWAAAADVKLPETWVNDNSPRPHACTELGGPK
ncbi:M56 family metallopeptidase [Pendulispora albinea]|uniref:M56 family metallopeptidase n=1 Tax=Pendulispora albinea TaxID=2741071 RepID=A0ABZ2LY17_9BACT